MSNPFDRSRLWEWGARAPDVPTSDTTLPNGVLPGDGKAVGYLYGYRLWQFHTRIGRLTSDNVAVVWKPRQPVKAEVLLIGVGKGAGIYAMKKFVHVNWDILTVAHYTTGVYGVIGKVALWGAVKEHQKGYRAEWAYPVEFLKIAGLRKPLDTALLRTISEIYLPR